MTMRIEAFEEHRRMCPDFKESCLGSGCRAFETDYSRSYWITVRCKKYDIEESLRPQYYHYLYEGYSYEDAKIRGRRR